MRNRTHWIRSLLLLAALAAVTAQASQGAQGASATPAVPRDVTDAARFHSARYEIHYMDLHAAEVLAWDQCPEALRERCQVTGMSTQDSRLKYLDVFADGPTHERIARALGQADSAPRTQVFQAVLLAASNRSGGAPPEVPAGAQKALADIKGFLPFKSYEPLDAVWLRTTQQAEGHMVGREGRQYTVNLRFKATGGPDSKDLFVDVLELHEDISSPPAGVKGPNRNPRMLIRTSFGLKQGETIVVGTSKSDDGEEALVLLLTAA